MKTISINDLRTYTNQKITYRLREGDTVRYMDSFWMVESAGLAVPFTLVPIRFDDSRSKLELSE